MQEERPFFTCGVAEQVVAAGRSIPAFSCGDARGIVLPQDAQRLDFFRCRLIVPGGKFAAALRRRSAARVEWLQLQLLEQGGRPRPEARCAPRFG